MKQKTWTQEKRVHVFYADKYITIHFKPGIGGFGFKYIF